MWSAIIAKQKLPKAAQGGTPCPEQSDAKALQLAHLALDRAMEDQQVIEDATDLVKRLEKHLQK